MGPRSFFTATVALFLATGCSSTHGGRQPGSTAPGHACTVSSDCGCWQCECAGVTGLPGAAQVCMDGECPTGDEACAPVCAIAKAQLSTATASDSCP